MISHHLQQHADTSLLFLPFNIAQLRFVFSQHLGATTLITILWGTYVHRWPFLFRKKGTLGSLGHPLFAPVTGPEFSNCATPLRKITKATFFAVLPGGCTTLPMQTVSFASKQSRQTSGFAAQRNGLLFHRHWIKTHVLIWYAMPTYTYLSHYTYIISLYVHTNCARLKVLCQMSPSTAWTPAFLRPVLLLSQACTDLIPVVKELSSLLASCRPSQENLSSLGGQELFKAQNWCSDRTLALNHKTINCRQPDSNHKQH